MSGSLAAKAIAAATRVYEVVVQTPTVQDKWLSRQSGSEAMLKLENKQVRLVLKAASLSSELLDSSDCAQVTGSFKARGAANKVCCIRIHERPHMLFACIIHFTSSVNASWLCSAGTAAGLQYSVSWTDASVQRQPRTGMRPCMLLPGKAEVSLPPSLQHAYVCSMAARCRHWVQISAQLR